MSDLIRREDAIEALGEEPYVWTDDDEFAKGERSQWIADVSAIKAVPSADRPQGEWKPLDRTWGRETWYCTNCEDAVVDMPTYMGIALYKYCPNCGARMKGADDE